VQNWDQKKEEKDAAEKKGTSDARGAKKGKRRNQVAKRDSPSCTEMYIPIRERRSRQGNNYEFQDEGTPWGGKGPGKKMTERGSVQQCRNSTNSMQDIKDQGKKTTTGESGDKETERST